MKVSQNIQSIKLVQWQHSFVDRAVYSLAFTRPSFKHVWNVKTQEQDPDEKVNHILKKNCKKTKIGSIPSLRKDLNSEKVLSFYFSFANARNANVRNLHSILSTYGLETSTMNPHNYAYDRKFSNQLQIYLEDQMTGTFWKCWKSLTSQQKNYVKMWKD